MLTILQSVLLGVLQGITEFLPISSSGHLVVVQQIFGWNAEGPVILAYDIALHVGTLLAVLVAFRKEVVEILTGRAWKLVCLLVVATIPAVIVGFSLKNFIEGLSSSVTVVGCLWLFAGTYLWCTRYIKEVPSENKIEEQVSFPKAFLIGCAQALAIFHGVSRSGSTISLGMFLKVNRTLAAKFAFLMSIPSIAGAAVLESKHIHNFPKEGIPQIIIGTVVSFVVAYFTIGWLLRLIQRGHFWWFGIYCWLAGAATLTWVALR